MIGSIIHGAGVGIGYALNGFFSKNKEKNTDIRKFDIKKFLPPVVIGIVVGGVAGYMGVGYEAAAATLEGFGVLTAVELGATILVKNFLKKVNSLLG